MNTVVAASSTAASVFVNHRPFGVVLIVVVIIVLVANEKSDGYFDLTERLG